jgi:hypothetical protein
VRPVSGATCNRIMASLRRAYSLGKETLGLVALTFLHLRETALTAAGVPAPVAMTISGHRTASVFQRYSIIAPATHPSGTS